MINTIFTNPQIMHLMIRNQLEATQSTNLFEKKAKKGVFKHLLEILIKKLRFFGAQAPLKISHL